jgi:hypothetical protein
LGRLTQAVREQNWAAVGIELVIVILGVVIGFQVTAWGQHRADRAKEQTYLRQLAADLHETERVFAEALEASRPPTQATRRIYQAFYAVERPSQDSLARWIHRCWVLEGARPVLGTAEALVATGDLALVRDDSLRTAIMNYLDTVENFMFAHDTNIKIWVDNSTVLAWRLVDRTNIVEFVPPAVRDARQYDPAFTQPLEGPRRDPFPFSPERFLTSREAYASILGMLDARANLTGIREQVAALARALREHIETKLNP